MQVINDNGIETKEMGGIKSIWNIFFEPSKVFISIEKKPKVIIAILMLIIISLLIVIPQIEIIENAARNNISKLFNNEIFQKTNPGFPTEMIDKQVDISVKIAKIFSFASPILVLLFVIVESLIFLGIFKIFGGKGNFINTFCVFLYSHFIVLLGNTAKAISVITTGNIEAGNSLGVFMTNDKTNFLYNLISNIDFFYVWSIIVAGIGLSIVHKISKSKSIYIMIFTWTIIILGYVGFNTFQAISMYEKYGITL